MTDSPSLHPDLPLRREPSRPQESTGSESQWPRRLQILGLLVLAPACAEYLAHAELYIQRAIQIAVASDYQASECMARIVRSRLLRLQGSPGDRTLLLEELANMARQHRDMALVCKAYTGIGQECEAVGKFDEAREWYRRAIAALKESKAIADTVWAQRALWRLEGEMDADEPPTADY